MERFFESGLRKKSVEVTEPLGRWRDGDRQALAPLSLNISEAGVDGDLRFTKAWLQKELAV